VNKQWIILAAILLGGSSVFAADKEKESQKKEKALLLNAGKTQVDYLIKTYKAIDIKKLQIQFFGKRNPIVPGKHQVDYRGQKPQEISFKEKKVEYLKKGRQSLNPEKRKIKE